MGATRHGANTFNRRVVIPRGVVRVGVEERLKNGLIANLELENEKKGNPVRGQFAEYVDSLGFERYLVSEFRMDCRPVTNAEYLDFWQMFRSVKSTWTSAVDSKWQELRDRNNYDPGAPVVGVSWPEAMAYAILKGGRIPQYYEYLRVVQMAGGRADLGFPAKRPFRCDSLFEAPSEWTSTPLHTVGGHTSRQENLIIAKACEILPYLEPDAGFTRFVGGGPIVSEGVGFRCAYDD